MRDRNLERALWARHGLLAYATGKEGGDDLYDEPGTVITDFLADLMHFAAQTGVDLRQCLIRADTHFDAERAPGTPPDEAARILMPGMAGAYLDLARFAGVHVEPVFEDREEGICVPVPDAPHTADFWTVYGRLPEGDAEGLIDCADEHSAYLAAAVLSRLITLLGGGAS